MVNAPATTPTRKSARCDVQNNGMRSLIALFIAFASIMVAPAHAQVLSVETYIEEWDPAQQQWVRVASEDEAKAERFLAAHNRPQAKAIAIYGPFRVHDQNRVSLVGVTDGTTPRHFAAVLRDFPEIDTLSLVECPGTDDDRANMRLGRMIRAAGIATHVPAHGSVRSGAVEVFLAGVERRIDDGAEFAVHSWLDDRGRQPHHFAADSPENRIYLDYYTEMGMAKDEARAFYDMTNSVEHADAKWLTAQDMRSWIGQSAPSDAPLENTAITAVETAESQPILAPMPTIAYLDLGNGFP